MPFKRMGSVLFKRQPLRRVSDQTGHQVLIAGGAGIHRDRRHIRAVPEAAERGIVDRQGQCGVERYCVSKIVRNGAVIPKGCDVYLCPVVIASAGSVPNVSRSVFDGYPPATWTHTSDGTVCVGIADRYQAVVVCPEQWTDTNERDRTSRTGIA